MESQRPSNLRRGFDLLRVFAALLSKSLALIHQVNLLLSEITVAFYKLVLVIHRLSFSCYLVNEALVYDIKLTVSSGKV
jgi:hypothetical protein